MAAKVTLGQHEVPVVGQSIPYLEHELRSSLGEVVGGFAGGEIEASAEGIMSLGWGTVYKVLGALIPDMKARIPEYQWHGYATREAFDSNDDDAREFDNTPTMPQVITAFEVVAQVNRWDALKSLGKVAEGLLERLGIDFSGLGERIETEMDSKPSSTSPSANGGSHSKTPSGLSPTTTANGG